MSKAPLTSKRSVAKLRSALKLCVKQGKLKEFLASLDEPTLQDLLYDWELWARPDQLAPRGQWHNWLVIGGRGAGKTRTGAEWVRGIVYGRYNYAKCPAKRIALIGETFADIRDVMLKGESGLLNICPSYERPKLEISKRQLVFPNGAIVQMMSAEEPESLRGPQFDAAWCDELAKWRYGRECWDMLQFALRLGHHPQCVITTTPKPVALLKELLEDQGSVISHATTKDNEAFLAKGFVKKLQRLYGNTRLGSQELEGQLICEREDALFARTNLDQNRIRIAPELTRIIVAVDPPVSATNRSDRCGIIIAGIDAKGEGYVLHDATLKKAAPLVWAAKAVALYHRYKADKVVVEVNQGGDMVKTILAQVDPAVPVKAVHATRGKYLRAEPVAALYEQNRVHHIGALSALEDEMCDFGVNGLSNGHSPDRLDALVWALTELMLQGNTAPRIRVV